MITTIIYLGTCLQLLGASLALDTYAGMPWAPDGYPANYCDDPNAPCTRSLIGGPIQYGDETECYLPTRFDDPWYAAYWCHPVTISGENGPVNVATACATDPEAIYAYEAPYRLRVYWADWNCPDWMREFGWCELENVCTPADKLAGDCACTAAEQANNECTP